QQQEVVAGTEARVVQQQVSTLTAATRQTFLHVPDFADRHGEAFRDGDALALLGDQFVGGFLHGRDRRHATVLQAQYALGQRWPQQGGKQECRGYRFVLLDAQVGVDQR